MLKTRVRHRLAGAHVHARVFMGIPDQTFALVGHLAMRVVDFDAFRRDSPAFEFIEDEVEEGSQAPRATADDDFAIVRDGELRCPHGHEILKIGTFVYHSWHGFRFEEGVLVVSGIPDTDYEAEVSPMLVRAAQAGVPYQSDHRDHAAWCDDCDRDYFLPGITIDWR